MKKYKEAMEHIRVTEEMRERILRNVEEAELTEKKTSEVPHEKKRKERKNVFLNDYRKYMPAAAALIVLVTAAVLIPKTTMKSEDLSQSTEQMQEGSVSGYVGISEAADAGALSEELGFPVTEISQLPFAAEEVIYSDYFGDMAQIEYRGKTDTLTYRKAKITGDEVYDSDISGVYETFPEEKQIMVLEEKVTLKGEEGHWQIAVWTADGFSYAVYDRQGLTEEQMTSIIEETVNES